jgi:hypothetical protein
LAVPSNRAKGADDGAMLPSKRATVLAKRVITIAMHTASAVPDDDDTAKLNAVARGLVARASVACR